MATNLGPRRTSSQGRRSSTTRSGLAFERATAQALRELGWDASLTSSTGDFGADVVARLGRTCAVVQCKDWASPAGFDAVKEVVYARLHYGARFALIVSRSGFTRQATEAAKKQDVSLLSLHDLKPGCAFDRLLEAQKLTAGAEERRLRIEAEKLDRHFASVAEAREMVARREMAARAQRLRENEERIAHHEQHQSHKSTYNSDAAEQREMAARAQRLRENEERIANRLQYQQSTEAYDANEAKRRAVHARNRARAIWVALIAVPVLVVLIRVFVDKKGDGPFLGYMVLVGFGLLVVFFDYRRLFEVVPSRLIKPRR